MKIVEVRSPFVIQINEATQLGSKIEIFIWNKGTTEPTTPTYTLSKPIPTVNQRLTSYNVSNFVKEYIDNIAPTYVNYPANNESVINYAFFRVKRYWDNAGVYTLLDSTVYVGVNGFTNYMDGLQTADDTRVKLLFNPLIKNNYQIKSSYPVDTIQYLNLLAEFDDINDTLTIEYEKIGGGYTAPVYFDGATTGVFLFKVPISLAKLDNNFVDGCKIKITYYHDVPGTTTVFDNIFTYPICEPKYTPVLCDFINRHGGWQTLTFYKAQTNSITAKSDDYKLMPNEVNYNPLRGQSKSFNFRGTQSVTLNTGWVDENYSELITDLLLSETILLDRKPASLKTQSSELKTKLKNRVINYTMEFEYNFNLINDVI
jgi:hypothetical protein